ncbi:MAG: hypothetical protein QG597_4053 [Actinomycetota bacterium]|nr:hypothetical protein [Actinomycetota bacterium]
MCKLQEILRAGFAAFTQHQGTRRAVHRWAAAVMACRTAALGGHLWRCPAGHVHRVQYNSCKHRACPQCGGLASEQWLQRLRARLLACDYYHLVFTVPHELNRLWQWNRVAFGELLLQTVRETLLTLTADPHWLGAQVGLVLSLHTWGRSLAVHPHVHALITGGGWTPAGWKATRRGYLLPMAVVLALFRGKLVAHLQQELCGGRLALPPDTHRAVWHTLVAQLRRRHWNVHLAGCYAHGRGVGTYLARYVRGGPLKASQLLAHRDGQVTFRYTDHRDARSKVMRLSTEDFIARLAEHVPEPGFRMVRHIGLLAPGNRARLAACRQQLGMLPSSAAPPLTAAVFLERLGLAPLTTCPICGQPLVRIPLERHRAPPPAAGTWLHAA